MRATDNKIIVMPLFGNRCKYEWRITGSYNDRILLHIVWKLLFCKSGSSIDGVEQKIIIVIIFLAKYQLTFAGITEFFNIEWECLRNMVLFCDFMIGIYRK